MNVKCKQSTQIPSINYKAFIVVFIETLELKFKFRWDLPLYCSEKIHQLTLLETDIALSKQDWHH